jgi:predicted nucleotidyltransferase
LSGRGGIHTLEVPVTDRVHYHPGLVYSAGSQVVTNIPVVGDEGRILHPRGAVGVVVKSPNDLEHAYRVRFPDGVEVSLKQTEVVLLAQYLEGAIGDSSLAAGHCNLFDRVIFRCVIGSQANGLADADSDVDRRGIYLPPGDLHWSLYGVPGQLERQETQEAYWELQRFLVLALKANPNVLECLFTPLVETATPLAEELLAMRSMFLSRVVYQTYNGYVMSQFKKMQADLRNTGEVKPKHVMHLIRLLIAGIEVLQTGIVPLRVEAHRERLLAIRRGEMPWDEMEAWRKGLHRDFDAALEKTQLPERPDYERANAFLIKARRQATAESEHGAV